MDARRKLNNEEDITRKGNVESREQTRVTARWLRVVWRSAGAGNHARREKEKGKQRLIWSI